MKPRIVLEPKIDAHDSALYQPDCLASGVDGFENVTDQQLADYDQQGYLLVRGGYSPVEVDLAKRELKAMTLSDSPACEAVYYEGAIRDHLAALATERDRYLDGDSLDNLALGQNLDGLPPLDPVTRAGFVRKFSGFVDTHPALAAFARKPALINLIERLTGQPSRLFQDMAMIKPPQGREKPWHQDHAYFNLPLDSRIVGVWIPLASVTPENGCMHLLAGAHRAGPHIHFKRRDWQICDTDIFGQTCTAVPMAAGDVLLFDAKLPHGTPTNQSHQQRWAVQFHYVSQAVTEVDNQVRLDAFGSEGKDVTC
ncbi:MAG: hypothetical protein CL610_25635 [Anaerolineaceae bacterium]|nr:hypothetical protein [Anaerolineaceae bacterium]